MARTASNGRRLSFARTASNSRRRDSSFAQSTRSIEQIAYNLTFSNVSLKVVNKKETIQVLKCVSGEAPSGEITGIMGSSGAGKTSLLRVLAGQINVSRTVSLEGDVKLNGGNIELSSFKKYRDLRLGYVGQKDCLLGGVTPREALRFSARLRLPKSWSEENIAVFVEQTLSDLRLREVADRPSMNLSGGEARRLSLGMELVTRPKVLLADEITSGLDSESAVTIMEVCKRIAISQRVAVLVTIHQPNREIFSMIDNVILMNHGRVMYGGKSDALEEFCAGKGYGMPNEMVLSDWVLRLAQTEPMETLESKGFFSGCESNLCKSSTVYACRSLNESALIIPKIERASLWMQMVEIFAREIQNLSRDYFAAFRGLLFCIILASVTGLCFFDTGTSLSNRVGVVIFIIACSGMFSSMLTLKRGIIQRPVIIRECAMGYYSLLSVIIVRAAINLLESFVYNLIFLVVTYWMVGLHGNWGMWLAMVFLHGFIQCSLTSLVLALPSKAETSLDIYPVIMAPQIILSGFIVAPDALPNYVRWATWFQPLVYAFRLLLSIEFTNCADLSPSEQAILSCKNHMEYIHSTFEEQGGTGIYSNSSTLTMPVAGTYKGTKDIIEYRSLFSPGQSEGSLLWNFCTGAGNQIILNVNEVREDGCDITFGDIRRTQVNPVVAYKDLNIEKTWLHMVYGKRINVTFGNEGDLGSLLLNNMDHYIPPAISRLLFNEVLNSTALAVRVCNVMSETCPSIMQANNYSSVDECIVQMDKLPLQVVNAHGLYTVDGNSTSCRNIHASLAQLSPEQHCPHISFRPIPDSTGNIKCSKSHDMDYTDYFTEENLLSFKTLAVRSGWDPEIQYETIDENNVPLCTTTFDTAAVAPALNLPKNFLCNTFLETQHATGENNMIYLLSLAALGLFYTAMTWFFLRRKAA